MTNDTASIVGARVDIGVYLAVANGVGAASCIAHQTSRMAVAVTASSCHRAIHDKVLDGGPFDIHKRRISFVANAGEVHGERMALAVEGALEGCSSKSARLCGDRSGDVGRHGDSIAAVVVTFVYCDTEGVPVVNRGDFFDVKNRCRDGDIGVGHAE